MYLGFMCKGFCSKTSTPKGTKNHLGPSRALFAVTSGVSIPLLGHIPAGLRSRGYDVRLFSGEHPEGGKQDPPDGLIHCTIPMDREASPLRDAIALGRVIRSLANLKPEIVVAGTPKAALLFMVAAFMTKVPVRVYFLLGLRLETATGLLRKVLWLTEKITVASSTHVVAVSESLKKSFVNQRLCHDDDVAVIGNGSSKGVNLVAFRPALRREQTSLSQLKQRLGLTPGVPIVGFFGRLHKDKGIDTLYEALTLLAERGIDHQLLVVGENETGGSDPLTAETRLRPSITVGHVQDIATYYRIIDVLCLPTFREGLPNVCLEASASEVPIVTTNATGAIDSVEHGVNGLLVNPGSPYDLAEALAVLLSSSIARERISQNSRQWVKHRFEEKKVETAYLAFLEALIHEVNNCCVSQKRWPLYKQRARFLGGNST